jgi:hypothetical protein
MKRKMAIPDDDVLKIISRAVGKFAASKTGALLVFPGREPIDRHTEGGFLLNGRISDPLLVSIFDKNSPGHDGALIIEGGRAKKFGAHLPLAEHLDSVKKYGTRHSAALGIAERSDALCIVVSEERGEISVARDGRIKKITKEENLETELRSFFNEKFPQRSAKNYKKFLKKNTVPIALSLVLAMAFWIAFNFQQAVVQRNFLAPVEVKNLQDNYTIENISEPELIVTLSGYERDFDLFDPSSLRVSIDVSGMKIGWHKVLITKENIKEPFSLDIVNIEPSNIKFSLLKKK